MQCMAHLSDPESCKRGARHTFASDYSRDKESLPLLISSENPLSRRGDFNESIGYRRMLWIFNEYLMSLLDGWILSLKSHLHPQAFSSKPGKQPSQSVHNRFCEHPYEVSRIIKDDRSSPLACQVGLVGIPKFPEKFRRKPSDYEIPSQKLFIESNFQKFTLQKSRFPTISLMNWIILNMSSIS